VLGWAPPPHRTDQESSIEVSEENGRLHRLGLVRGAVWSKHGDHRRARVV
jgi:hypothetical protein